MNHMLHIFESGLALGLPGGSEWLIIVLIILLLFGGSKIPQLMRGVGRGVGELQKGLADGKRALDRAAEEDDEEEPNRANRVRN